MTNEKLKEIGDKIVLLEKDYRDGDEKAAATIEQLMSSLSIEEMLNLDDYIMNKIFENNKNL